MLSTGHLTKELSIYGIMMQLMSFKYFLLPKFCQGKAKTVNGSQPLKNLELVKTTNLEYEDTAPCITSDFEGYLGKHDYPSIS